MRKSVKFDWKLVQLSSDQLTQSLQVYVVRGKANLRLTELNINCNITVQHDKKKLSSKGNKLLIDLFSKNLLINWVMVRTATGVTDTLIVNEIKNNSRLLMFLQLTLTYSLPCWTRLRERVSQRHNNGNKWNFYQLMKFQPELVLKWKSVFHLHMEHLVKAQVATYGRGKMRIFKKSIESTWQDIMHGIVWQTSFTR